MIPLAVMCQDIAAARIWFVFMCEVDTRIRYAIFAHQNWHNGCMNRLSRMAPEQEIFPKLEWNECSWVRETWSTSLSHDSRTIHTKPPPKTREPQYSRAPRNAETAHTCKKEALARLLVTSRPLCLYRLSRQSG